MEKNYIKPEVKVTNITADDIIMTSGLPTEIAGRNAQSYGEQSYTDLFEN